MLNLLQMWYNLHLIKKHISWEISHFKTLVLVYCNQLHPSVTFRSLSVIVIDACKPKMEIWDKKCTDSTILINNLSSFKSSSFGLQWESKTCSLLLYDGVALLKLIQW